MTWFLTPWGFEGHCVFYLLNGYPGGTRNNICHHLKAYLSSRGVFLTSFENLTALVLSCEVRYQNSEIKV